MDQSRSYAFVDFAIHDETAFDRLLAVTDELRRQKGGGATRNEDYWLPYFTETDRMEFCWLSDAETEQWNKFWFSTPLPERHSPEMPTPPWHFGSMIDAIMDGEYDLIGVRKLIREQARFEIDPHAYPYGGIGAVRALVRAFGHHITGFDDGTGYVDGDPQSPRWNADMPAIKSKKPSFWDHSKRR